jgi:cell division control protein 6
MADSGGMLGWDETVFRDERVFEVDWVPETFRHRDSQLESLKYAFRPAARGSRPLNVMARGPPGTGKTTAIKLLFDQIDAETDVATVRVNCQVESTRYAVFSRIFEALFDYEPPSSGVAFKKLFRKIADHLADEDRVLIVALDDVNYLCYENEASDTLYSLLRAHEVREGARIGVAVVSSDLSLDLMEALDDRVRSVFRPDEVYFAAYDEPAIVDILGDRVDRGFVDDAVPPTALDRVAELTAETGDLRVGIDLLRRAGLRAESRGSRSVDPDDVEAAYEQAQHAHLSRRLQGLSDSETALLETIAEGGGQAGDVYEAFHERTGLGYTRYAELVDKLEKLDLIETEYADIDGRGRSRSLSLAHDADAVRERLHAKPI